MSGLDEPGELGGGDQSNIAGSPASNDHRFLLVHDLIENTGQVFAKARIRSFSGHREILSYGILVRPRCPTIAGEPIPMSRAEL